MFYGENTLVSSKKEPLQASPLPGAVKLKRIAHTDGAPRYK